MEVVEAQTEKAKRDLNDLFDISRFDTGFMDDIVCLLKPEPAKKMPVTPATAPPTTS